MTKTLSTRHSVMAAVTYLYKKGQKKHFIDILGDHFQKKDINETAFSDYIDYYIRDTANYFSRDRNDYYKYVRNKAYYNCRRKEYQDHYEV